MKSNLLFNALCISASLFYAACGNNGNQNNGGNAPADSGSHATTNTGEGTNPKGIGKYTNVQLTHPLDKNMIAAGEKIYNVKCGSCHKLTNEKLVGPGWKGVTDRRTPEWIMNFVTNTEEMVQKDTAALNLLEICLVKMPNQNLTEQDARSMLEFMRNNDGKQ